MKKHLQLQIKGKVQGVWYRASTQQKAEELGLCGLVKNLPNGDVYVEAEGDETSLQALIEWCKAGPPLAKVDHIEITPGTPKNFTAFRVER